MQIAELYQMQPGTPVSNLRAVVKRANPPKASTGEYGGHSQILTIADASAEIDVFIFDGPALSQGMSVMLTADAKGGCYTEVREHNGQQKLRLTVKGKVAGRVNILSGGGQPQPQPQLQPTAGWQQQPAVGWQGQPVQGYAQAGPALPSPAASTPAALPAQQLSWAPKSKMTDRQLRHLLLRQFGLIRDAVAESLGTQPSTLEPELLGHCMAWATSVGIAFLRGDIEAERSAAEAPAPLPPPQNGAMPEQWPGQVPGMQRTVAGPAGQTGALWQSADLPSQEVDDDIPF